MSKIRKYSILVRSLAGILAVLGLSAIAFDARLGGGIRLDLFSLFVLFAKLFAAYIFSYVAIFGQNPLSSEDREKSDS